MPQLLFLLVLAFCTAIPAAASPKHSSGKAPKTVDAFLQKAREQGVHHQRSRREKSLKRAKRLAKKQLKTEKSKRAKHRSREQIERIDTVLKTDFAYAVVRKSVRSAERKHRPLKETGPLLSKQLHVGQSSDRIKTLRRGLAAYKALKDAGREASARVLLLRVRVLTSRDTAKATKARLRASTKLLSRLSREANNPATAAPRRQLRQLRATLLLRLNRFSSAAYEQLLADRLAQPARANGAQTGKGAYLRSRRGAKICEQAAAHGVNCANLEQQRFGDRTYYDFSREKTRRFSDARAKAVRTEYEQLLKDCVLTTKQLNALDVQVTLNWQVGNDGHVSGFETDPRRLATGQLGRCLTQAFATFRYPRFLGPAPSFEVRYDLDLKD